MQGGATSNTGLSLNSASLRQRHSPSHWKKTTTSNNMKKRPFNKYHLHWTMAKHEQLKKKLCWTTATIIFCFLTFSFLSLFFSFSKKYSLATWSTSCSTDYSNIEYALWAVEQKQTAPSHNSINNPCAFLFIFLEQAQPAASSIGSTRPSTKGTSKATFFLWFV